MHVCIYPSGSAQTASARRAVRPTEELRVLLRTAAHQQHHFLRFDLLHITPSGNVNIGNGIFGGGMLQDYFEGSSTKSDAIRETENIELLQGCMHLYHQCTFFLFKRWKNMIQHKSCGICSILY